MDDSTTKRLDHVYAAVAALGGVAVVTILILVMTWRPVCSL
jgi:hypothetical protein